MSLMKFKRAIRYPRLETLSDDMVQAFQRMTHDEFYALIRTRQDYHGTEVSRLPEVFIKEIVSTSVYRHYYKPNLFWGEIVHVFSDISSETHLHKHKEKFVTVLHSPLPVDGPRNAYVYHPKLNQYWAEVTPYTMHYFDLNEPHGFKVLDGGVLWYLSLEFRRKIRVEEDDYVLIP